jgi:hypothetical protein
MSYQLATSVGGIFGLTISLPTVHNSSGHIVAQGIESLSVGCALSANDVSGRHVALDFADAAPSRWTHLTFGSNVSVAVLGKIDAMSIGDPTVYLYSTIVRPSSIDAPQLSLLARVVDAHMPLVLRLTEELYPNMSMGVDALSMSWGFFRTIVPKGFDSVRFNDRAVLRIPRHLLVAGINGTLYGYATRVIDASLIASNIVFDFGSATEHDSNGYHRWDFSPEVGMCVTGFTVGDKSVVGTPGIKFPPQARNVTISDKEQFGRPIFMSHGQNNPLFLNFFFTAKPAAVPMGLYWGDAKSAIVQSMDATQFGVPEFGTNMGGAWPVGFSVPHLFGQSTFTKVLEDRPPIPTHGSSTMVFGMPTAAMLAKRLSIKCERSFVYNLHIGSTSCLVDKATIDLRSTDSMAVGTPAIKTDRLYITPGLMPRITFGDHAVYNNARVIDIPTIGLLEAFGLHRLWAKHWFVRDANVGVCTLFGVHNPWNRTQVAKPAVGKTDAWGLIAVRNKTLSYPIPSFTATAWGLASVVNAAWTIAPSVGNCTQWGLAGFMLHRSIYQFHGFDSLSVGDFGLHSTIPEITPDSFVAVRFGGITLTLKARVIEPVRIAEMHFGLYNIELASPSKIPDGIDSLVFGSANVENDAQSFKPFGIRSLEFPITAAFDLAADSFTPVHFSHMAFGRAVCSLGDLNVSGTHVLVFGDPRITVFWHGIPCLTPAGLEQTQWGQIRVVSSLFLIEPETLNDVKFGQAALTGGNALVGKGHDFFVSGTPSTRNKSLSFTPEGFDVEQTFGTPDVKNQTPIICPLTFSGMWFGSHDVSNAAQAIYLVPIANLKFGKFYPWAVTQIAYPAPFDMTSYGVHIVRNKTEEIKARYIYSLEWGQFVVKNNAKVLGQRGALHSLFGNTRVYNSEQSISFASGLNSVAFGASAFYTRALCAINAIGSDYAQCGTPSLISTNTSVFVGEFELLEFGEFEIRNKNQVLALPGLFNKEEYGEFTIELATESHTPESIVCETLFGEFAVTLASPNVTPDSFEGTEFGEAALTLAAQACVVENFGSEEFGEFIIELTAESFVPYPIHGLLFGQSSVELVAVLLHPGSIRSLIMSTGHDVVNAAFAPAVNGLNSTEFGNSVVQLSAASFTPTGFVSFECGESELALAAFAAYPDGIYRGFMSTGHFIENFTKTPMPESMDQLAFGEETEVRNVSHTIIPESELDVEFGKPIVELANPSVEVYGIGGNVQFGRPTVELASESCELKGFDSCIFTTPYAYLVSKSFTPFGFDGLKIGRTKVRLNTLYVPMQGFDSARYVGYTEIRLASPSRKIGGLNSLVFSQPDVKLLADAIKPDYFCKQVFGAHTIELRGLHTTGYEHVSVGKPSIELVTPSIVPRDIDDLAFGDVLVANKIRSILAESLFEEVLFGEAEIELVTPSVVPESFVGTPQFGRPTIANVSPSIVPYPFCGLWFGVAELTLAAQGCNVVSIVDNKFGPLDVRLASPSVKPKPISSVEWGTYVIDLVADTLHPAGIRSYIMSIEHTVVNAARALYANGLNTLVFGRTSLDLAAESFTPRGMYSFEGGLTEIVLKDLSVAPDGIYRGYVSANHFIENVIKTIAPEGFELTVYGELTEIFNVSHTVAPEGIIFTKFGCEDKDSDFLVELANPSVVPDGIISNVQYGRPTVALASQSCSPLSINKSVVTVPNICLATLSFAPESLVEEYFGRTNVKLYTRYIGLQGFTAYQYAGYTEIKLATPSRKMGGLTSLVFGTALLELGARSFTPGGFEKPLFGQAWISLRWLFPESVNDGAISEPSIRLVTPTLLPKSIESMSVAEFEIYLRTPSALPEGIFKEAFGQAEVENAMPEITPESIVCETLFGEPAVRNVSPSITPFPFIVTRFGPVTIALDSMSCNIVPIAELRFGKLDVRLASPSVVPPGIASTNLFGLPDVMLAAKDAKVKGFDSLRFEFGFTKVELTAKAVRAQGVIHGAIGQPTIENDADSFTPSPISGPVFGTHEVVNDAFAIAGRSIDSLVMGELTHVVNEKRAIYIGDGIDSLEFGELFARLKIPFLRPDSIYDFWIMDPTIELANPSVVPHGFEATSFGEHEIANVAQGIFAEGIEHKDSLFGRHDIWLWAKSFTPHGVAPPLLMQFTKVALFDREIKVSSFYRFAFGMYLEVKLANPSRVMKGLFSTEFGALEVTNAARSIRPDSFIGLMWGIHWLQKMRLIPAPMDLIEFGLGDIRLGNPSVVPDGISSFASDLHFIKNDTLMAAFRGTAFTRFGIFVFEMYPQYIELESLVNEQVFGDNEVFIDMESPTVKFKIKPDPFMVQRFGSFWLCNAAKGAAMVSIANLKFGHVWINNAAKNFTPKGIFDQHLDIFRVFLTARLVKMYPFTALEYGRPEVGGNRGWFAPWGFRATGWGDFTVAYQLGTLQVRGWWREFFGYPTIRLKDQRLRFFSEYPVPLTKWGLETDIHIVVPQKVINATMTIPVRFGGHLVSHFTRWIGQYNPHLGGFVGSPDISFFRRRIDVPWMGYVNIGRPNVHRFNPIMAGGRDYLTFGRAVQTFGNMLYYIGFTDMQKGNAWVSHSPRVINMKQSGTNDSFPDRTTYVFNSMRRVIFTNQEEYMGVYSFGRAWFENKSKEIYVPGISSMRFKTQFEGVFNKARQLVHPGLNATQWMTKHGFVAFAIRSLNLPGMNAMFVPKGSLIHNAATAIVMKDGIYEFIFSGYGNRFENTRRLLRHHTGSITQFGTAYADFGVRWLHQIRTNTDLAKYGKPNIGLGYWVVEPAGIVPPPTGLLFVYGPFRRGFTPKWPMAHIENMFGIAKVWNFNPQVWHFGRPYFESTPLHWISHAPRNLEPSSIRTLVAPKFSIKDRRLFIWPDGRHPWICDKNTRIANTVPEPIPAPKVDFTGFGLAPCLPSDRLCMVGEPSVRYNMIMFPDGGDDFLGFGSIKVRAMGCFIRNSYASMEFGRPLLSAVRTMVASGKESAVYGWPRVSPHTIWATEDTPQQAARNHPEGPSFEPFQPIERNCWPVDAPKWPCWSKNRVELANRTVFHHHNSRPTYASPSSRFGEATLAGGVQYVSAKSIVKRGFGVPEFIPRTKRIMMMGFLAIAFGTHRLRSDSVFNITIYQRASDMLSMGDVNAELLHRPVYVNGFERPLFGNNKPMVYFPRHIYDASVDDTKWGKNWISHYIREFPMEGFETFTTEWERFKWRMIVSGGKGHDTWNNRIEPHGINSAVFGTSYVQFGIIHVYVYMIPPLCIPCCNHRINHT